MQAFGWSRFDSIQERSNSCRKTSAVCTLRRQRAIVDDRVREKVHRVRKHAYGYGRGAAVKINAMHCRKLLGTTLKCHCADSRRCFIPYQPYSDSNISSYFSINDHDYLEHPNVRPRQCSPCAPLPTTAASSPQRVPEGVAACFDPHHQQDRRRYGLALRAQDALGHWADAVAQPRSITLEEREPTPESVGISTPLRSVWPTGQD